MEEGFVKIYRSLLAWEWFDDAKTLQVWIYILLRVQWEDTRWRGIQIKRGQMLESLPSIAENTGLSVQSVRTAISHLKSTGEITDYVTGFGRLITVIKWADFQGLADDGNRLSNRLSNRRSTDDQQHIKKNKKEKNKERVKREDESSSFSPPSLSDVSEFVESNNLNVDPERFWLYYQAKAWKGITDWPAAILLWSKRERPDARKKDVLPAYMEGREEEY